MTTIAPSHPQHTDTHDVLSTVGIEATIRDSVLAANINNSNRAAIGLLRKHKVVLALSNKTKISQPLIFSLLPSLLLTV